MRVRRVHRCPRSAEDVTDTADRVADRLGGLGHESLAVLSGASAVLPADLTTVSAPFTLSSLAVAAISRSRTRKRSLLCASNNGKVGADLVIPDGRVLADAATICLSESGQRFPARALLR
jgi:hypothetical protein